MRARSTHDFRPNWRGTSGLLIPSLRLSPKRKCLRITIVIVVLTLLTIGLDIFLSGGSALSWLLQIWTGFNLSGKSVHAGESFYIEYIFLIYIYFRQLHIMRMWNTRFIENGFANSFVKYE